MNQSEIVDMAMAMVDSRGEAVMLKAKQKILNTTYDNGVLDLAMKHYAKANLPFVLPLFPALISLSYETVAGCQGGDELESIAVAMVLIAFSADIHDDVIDQSAVKYGKKTIYGVFGSEIAILAGDVLLIQGQSLLHQACEGLLPKQRREISDIVPKALFELSCAEALEFKLSKNAVIEPDEYFEIMRLKGVFAELQCRIGGILGCADDELLAALACYGRAVGTFGTIKDEFSDMLNVSELEHRIKFECPPLPLVCAVKDEEVNVVIKALVEQFGSSKHVVKKISRLVLKSGGVYNLRCKINVEISQSLEAVSLNEKLRASNDMFLLLQALLPDV
jgi:geranylgeranyl pyrophosphate synthase